jgi:hypothetical protein
MNKLLSALTLAFVTSCPLAGLGQASLESDPAYLPIDKVLDLKTIRPEVNINLPRFLLKDAASELNDKAGDKGTDFADLIKDVKLIRLVVIEANHTNRPALDKAMQKLRADLEAKWTAIVSVPEEKVGIYAMGDPSGETVAGMAMLICDGNDAVIGNIVGRVSIGKVIKLASQSGKLPKDVLKKLQGMADKTNSEKDSAADGDAKANKPAEAAEAPAKGNSEK